MLVPSSQGSGSVAAASHAGIITNLLVGAPAHRSKQFRKGDRVVKVDETAIDDHGHDLTKLLVGSDVPGSLVTVHVTRGGQPMPAITLTRACMLRRFEDGFGTNFGRPRRQNDRK